jgi:hypothetical protein
MAMTRRMVVSGDSSKKKLLACSPEDISQLRSNELAQLAERNFIGRTFNCRRQHKW